MTEMLVLWILILLRWMQDAASAPPECLSCACRRKYLLLACSSSSWLQTWLQPLWYYQNSRFSSLCSLNLQWWWSTRLPNFSWGSPYYKGHLHCCFILFSLSFPASLCSPVFVFPPVNLSIITSSLLVSVLVDPCSNGEPRHLDLLVCSEEDCLVQQTASFYVVNSKSNTLIWWFWQSYSGNLGLMISLKWWPGCYWLWRNNFQMLSTVPTWIVCAVFLM